MKRDNITLKTYFETGDYPTEAQFADLIDSFLNIEEEDAVTGITNNGDGTYSFQLLSGGIEVIDVGNLSNNVPISSVVGLQAILDALPSQYLQKNQDESTTGNLSIDMANFNGGKSFSVGAPGSTSYFSMNSGGWSIFGNVSANDGQDSHIIIKRNGGLEFNDRGTVQKIWHEGNDGSGSGLDADTLDGIQLASTGNNGQTWGYVPLVKTDGVMEVGRYIDFHTISNSGVDRTFRMDAITDTQLRISATNSNTDCIVEAHRDNARVAQLIGNSAGAAIVLKHPTLTATILRSYGASDFFGGGINVHNGGISTGDSNTSGQLTVNKGDTANCTLAFEDNYLRWRRGGNGTVAGWRWDNFDSLAAQLSTGGILTVSGSFATGSTILDSGKIDHSGSSFSFLNGSSALPINTNNLLVSNAYVDRSKVPSNGAYIKGSIITDGILISNTLTNRTGQQLVLNAGESAAQATGQTNEWVYINAESGLEVNCSPNNWSSGWAGRVTHQLNANGASIKGNVGMTGDLTVSGNNAFMAASNARVKWSVWNSTTYGIGMQSGMTMGNLNDFAMTFQMNSDNDRGFWWGDSSHTNSQGAMALSTNGFLTLANHMRVGYGESDTANVSTTYTIQANGTMQATNFILSSDRRLKENIKDYAALPISVRWRTFDWIEGDKNQLGVIAQELQEAHPEYVVQEEDGKLSVKYIDLLVAKMAEKDRQLTELQESFKQLEKRIDSIVQMP